MLPLLLLACATEEVTWHEDVHPIVASRCEVCHQPGGSGPIPLTTWEEVTFYGPLIDLAVREDKMPPWPPDDGCRPYQHDLALDPTEREVLLGWLAAGMPEGKARNAVEVVVPEPESLQPDRTLQIPAYTPLGSTDDYRCQLVDWSDDAAKYVTGFEVVPGRGELVHHVIAYIVEPDMVAEFEAADGADGRPGYPCFGDATPPSVDLGLGALRWLAAWAPGVRTNSFPDGTGIRVEPGSKLAVQMHYNTLADEPVEDASTISVTLADDVPSPAAIVPFTSPVWVTGEIPMTIPAGEPEVTHRYNADIGQWWWSFARDKGLPIQGDDRLKLHSASLHMHLLGQEGSLQIERPDGSRECLLQIPRWNFNWQGSYVFEEPVIVGKEDAIRLSCTWDNSTANQPVIDGERIETADRAWGDGTTDEMCLGLMFVTRAD